MTRVDGSYSDGYADDLSIVLPETDEAAGCAAASLALAAARRRRRGHGLART